MKKNAKSSVKQKKPSTNFINKGVMVFGKKDAQLGIVKRKGKAEPFDERKAYGSIFWACKSVGLQENQSESISAGIVNDLKKKLELKNELDSKEIFRFVSAKLFLVSKPAAHKYKELEKEHGISSTPQVHIVKRKGHLELYDEKKAYASIYWASKSAHLNELEAEFIAETVMKELNAFIATKKMINSAQILKFVAEKMTKINSDAAYMYEKHMDIN
ncbi:hypothetical protein HY989_04895 [Candidatus Micrarchaeota archaeon]|nr:hypothetical protein [Candidatus Micrarchaeota archaeon]